MKEVWISTLNSELGSSTDDLLSVLLRPRRSAFLNQGFCSPHPMIIVMALDFSRLVSSRWNFQCTNSNSPFLDWSEIQLTALSHHTERVYAHASKIAQNLYQISPDNGDSGVLSTRFRQKFVFVYSCIDQFGISRTLGRFKSRPGSWGYETRSDVETMACSTVHCFWQQGFLALDFCKTFKI